MSGSNLALTIGDLQLDIWEEAKIAIRTNRHNRSLHEYSNKVPSSREDASTKMAET